MAEWTVPTSGMFLWLKIPGVEDTEKLIKEKALQKGVSEVNFKNNLITKQSKMSYLLDRVFAYLVNILTFFNAEL